MTLSDYLQSEQAREDVRGLCSADGFWLINGLGRLEIAQTGAWRVLWLIGERERLAAYYRPDGDRFVVTDMGEGVRALRLKGCDLSVVNGKLREALGRMWRDNLFPIAYAISELTNGEIGTPYRVSAADLPDAICRVMLASLRVAEVSP